MEGAQESIDPHERSHYNCAVGCAFIAAVHHGKDKPSLTSCSEWFPIEERGSGDAVSMASLAEVLKSQGIPAIPARVSDKRLTPGHLPAILLLSHGVTGAEAGHYVYAVSANDHGVTIIDPNNAVDSLLIDSSELATFWDGKLLVLRDSGQRISIFVFVFFWTIVSIVVWWFIRRPRDGKQVPTRIHCCWLILILGCEEPHRTTTEVNTEQGSNLHFTYDSNANEYTLSIPVAGIPNRPLVVTNVRTSCQCLAPKTWVGRLIAPEENAQLPLVIDIRNRTEVSGIVTIEFDTGNTRTYRLFGAECYPPRFLERHIECEYADGLALPSGRIVIYQSRTAEQPAWEPESPIVNGEFVSLSFEKTNSTTRFQGVSAAATAVLDRHEWLWQMDSIPENVAKSEELTVSWKSHPTNSTSIPFRLKHVSVIKGFPESISTGQLQLGREWIYQFVCHRRGNLPFSIVAANSSHDDVEVETVEKAPGLFLIRIHIVAKAPERDFRRTLRFEFLPTEISPVIVRLTGTAARDSL